METVAALRLPQSGSNCPPRAPMHKVGAVPAGSWTALAGARPFRSRSHHLAPARSPRRRDAAGDMLRRYCSAVGRPLLAHL
eukprot:8943612-Alexandrium_andersonii.AAC.1